MPYAAGDRKEFIERSGIDPGSRILDFGGVLYEELPSSVSGITARKQLPNAIVIKPALVPFKDSVFDAVVSYHYFDLIHKDMIGYVFREAARVLKKDSNFSFMLQLWAPQNEAQRSSLFFNELLKASGAIYAHEFTDITGELSDSGFCDITVETIKRNIIIPPDFVKLHLILLGSLVKKEQDKGIAGIKTPAKQYFEHVKEYGEAMLPALHFMAKKI
ncbi:MAG: methyltransferase domain-containing protein [Euryarchaeota archaeon]|nr:methyltransferase domain-containing protein [Euryarchaeota archaeon]